jgi:phenylalanyl-tRNA synthetase beta chain
LKASYKWLKEYCEFNSSPEELAVKLTDLGLKVEFMEKKGDDVCYEVETLYSRPDTLCHIGVAREIAALLGLDLKLPEFSGEGNGKDVGEWTSVEILDEDLCPCYTARIISGVKVGLSPEWLSKRLLAIGVAPVNNVVDATNYVMMETGQPLHAFDYATLEEGRIVVRRAKAREKILTIDHVERELDKDTLVIADGKKPVAVAGVMGGLGTEVGEGTKTVLLESAHFDPLNVRRTSRKLGLDSEASYRFERRIDPKGVDASSRRAAELIREVAGGEIAKGVAVVDVRKEKTREAELRQLRMNLLLGMEIPMDEAEGILRRLGFEIVERTEEKVRVRAPSWRGDIDGEADLIEEVARVYGYDKVPTEPKASVRLANIPRWLRMEQRTRDLLVAMGYYEINTVTLVAEDLAEVFSHWSERKPLAVRNPVRAGEGALRKSLLASLLPIRKLNQDHGAGECRLFEIGRAFLPGEGGKQPEEKKLIALLDDGDYFDLKGVVEEFFEGLGVAERPKLEQASVSFLESGAGARITLGGEMVGYIGKAASELAERLGLKNAPQVCELDAEKVWSAARDKPGFRPLPQFPSTKRDLAVVVAEDVTWEAMREEVDKASSEIVREVAFFDVYRGEGLPAGKKSIAFSVVYRADDRTLSRKESEAVEEVIVAALKKRFGAELRSG